jgi:hypothetical protein
MQFGPFALNFRQIDKGYSRRKVSDSNKVNSLLEMGFLPNFEESTYLCFAAAGMKNTGLPHTRGIYSKIYYILQDKEKDNMSNYYGINFYLCLLI